MTGAPTGRRGGGSGAPGGERGKPRGRGRGRSGGGGGGGGGSSRSAGDDSASGGRNSTVGSGTRSRSSENKAKRKATTTPRAPVSARPLRTVHTVTRKVVVRNIPHTISEDDVWQLLATHGVTREYGWRFVAGKVRGNNRQPHLGRLYLDFKKETEQAKQLIAALNGYSELTASVHVLCCVADKSEPLDVDFAPYQKIPREKQRKDAKVGTIERDPEYLAFVEELNKPKEKLPSADVVADNAEGETVEKPVAALVKYFNERKLRDKKGKAISKYDKSSATRRSRKKEKPAKEKKGGKERSKQAEGGDGADGSKARKPRGRGKKEAASAAEPMQPGSLKIMPKGGSNNNNSGGERTRGRGRKEPGDADASAPVRGNGKGRGRREPRGPRGGAKDGEGRNDRHIAVTMHTRGDPTIKLVLLGNGSVGKSSLIARFVDDGFTRVYKQTIGLDFFEKKLHFPRDQRLVLQVWDIGGQSINSKMLDKYLYGVDVAFLCYDVTDAQSFQDLDDWCRVAKAHTSNASAVTGRQTGLYVLGNKVDLVAHRVISTEKHEEFIRRHQLLGGFLVSAQNGDNVLKAVYRVSATAAKIQVSDFELSAHDTVVRATVQAATAADEARTAMADAIEAEDRAAEARKAEGAGAPAGCHCSLM
ncbi:TPA: hypothetical protein N0F65_011556 [Lagenidium giganteum]|uniref:UPF3 domain-containing protein n=1 Tax=Lagenidium giganteum TaxID=4803 RepID=A0AAV2YKW7_9STRA|nr:TPA: hypothetical protein N0F65_011556 [Lagenidium giganteum]